jgi:hypothetical protein
MASIVVTPLQPPFTHSVMHFEFDEKGSKILTVSTADGERIKELLGGYPINRTVILGPIPGNDRDITVSVLLQ